MTRDELLQLVTEVQERQCELNHVEVKTARGGTPQRLYESLSAFANRPGGGIVLCGLEESEDFTVVGVGQVQKLQEDVTSVAADMERKGHAMFFADKHLWGYPHFIRTDSG